MRFTERDVVKLEKKGISVASATRKGPKRAAPKSKYRNKKIVVDGYTFDSQKQAQYYEELKLRKKAGNVKFFVVEPVFLLPAGIKVQPDFLVCHSRGLADGYDFTVEDVKAFDEATGKYIVTRESQLKFKLLKEAWGLEIQFV